MGKPDIRLRLTDPDLFGNDAAEDEDEAIFSSYVLERDEAAQFRDPSEKIRVVRAYKGEGKSALLRFTRLKLGSDEIALDTTGPAISPDIASDDTDVLVRAWKERIFRTLASEIGRQIGMAWSDDAISLVEEAEKNGFKSRSVVSAIVDRLKLKVIPVNVEKQIVVNPEKLIQRWSKGVVDWLSWTTWVRV